jgi:hypothetical protein
VTVEINDLAGNEKVKLTMIFQKKTGYVLAVRLVFYEEEWQTDPRLAPSRFLTVIIRF